MALFATSIINGADQVDRKVTIPVSDNEAADNITADQDRSIIFVVELDLTENPGENTFTRFFASAAPTVGSDVAEMVLKGIAGRVTVYYIEDGVDFQFAGAAGLEAASDISVATVREPGTTNGATSPSGTVKVTNWFKTGVTP